MKVSQVKEVRNDIIMCCVLRLLSERVRSCEGGGQALQSRLVWNQQALQMLSWMQVSEFTIPKMKRNNFQGFSRSKMTFWNCSGFASFNVSLLLLLYYSSWGIFFLFYNYRGELWLTPLIIIFFLDLKILPAQ